MGWKPHSSRDDHRGDEEPVGRDPEKNSGSQTGILRRPCVQTEREEPRGLLHEPGRLLYTFGKTPVSRIKLLLPFPMYLIQTLSAREELKAHLGFFRWQRNTSNRDHRSEASGAAYRVHRRPAQGLCACTPAPSPAGQVCSGEAERILTCCRESFASHNVRWAQSPKSTVGLQNHVRGREDSAQGQYSHFKVSEEVAIS